MKSASNHVCGTWIRSHPEGKPLFWKVGKANNSKHRKQLTQNMRLVENEAPEVVVLFMKP
jgi:hypothetical protein